MQAQLLQDVDKLDFEDEAERDHYKEKLLRRLRSALAIKCEPNDQLPIGSSKFGGKPDLPPGFLYPLGGDGKPLSFIAQYRLQDLQAFSIAHDLPATGMLYFFAFDDTVGRPLTATYRPEWASISYWDGDPATLQPYEAGEEVRKYTQAKIWFEEALSGFHLFYEELDCTDLIGGEEFEYIDLMGKYENYRHQLLGLPVPQQPWNIRVVGPHGEVERVEGLQDEFEGHVLLLQMDCDSKLGTRWGDCGTIYFVLSLQDLVQHHFENFLFLGQHG
ncbi:DUF1963 domain-containing protein [Ktedonosporobacter rubrisoli]|nr:YwqG family protein [Ktedonosporobacter rubrisoli]